MASQTILSTIAGCVGCQAGVELLQREVKDSLNLLTLATFVFISIEGLIFQSRFFTRKQHIPTTAYLKIVALFFVVNVCNNYSLKFNVYFPLFIIFKSASLLANMILGFALRNRFCTGRQVFSVVIVTAGIVIFALASYDGSNQREVGTTPEWAKDLPIPPEFIGILLLSIAVLISAYLGICQEDLYHNYGRHADESMFYVHFLSLPIFALLGDDISSALQAANRSNVVPIMGYSTILPIAWIYIIGICFLQWLCITNVYRLTAVTSSLNVTMVTSIRKFLSIFISFVVFGNPFNIFHLAGSFFVFIGSLMFSRVF